MTTTIRYLPEDELIRQALVALMNALGPVEATRFLSLTRADRVESVTRHRQWQATLNRDAFFDQIFSEETNTVRIQDSNR